LKELEGQNVELLPDRIEMRRKKRGRYDCDAAQVNTGVLNAPGADLGANNNDFLSGNNTAAVCFSQ
jgi:hypothetical protein